MKAVIFDMDGIIFDSERAVFNGWLELSEKYGFQELKTPYWKCIGVNAATTKRIFLDFYGEDFPYDEYSREQSANYHRKYDGGRLPLKKGVKELLEYLKQENYYVAIASSTRKGVVEQQIIDAGLRPYFDFIVGGDMVTKSKPEPDIFLKAIEGQDVDVSEVYVIEDSYNGIRAAKRAGMRPVMVPDLLEPDEEMRTLAHVILTDLLCVKAYLMDQA